MCRYIAYRLLEQKALINVKREKIMKPVKTLILVYLIQTTGYYCIGLKSMYHVDYK